MQNAMTNVLKPLMVVDLDGTLISGNSLHIYIKEGFKRVSLLKKILILWLLFLRRMRIISHKKMKFGCLKYIDSKDAILHKRFVQCVMTKLNARVTRQVKEFDGAVLLATAAPDVYIPWIWDGQYIATRTENNPMMDELRGEAKAAAVSEYAHRHNLTPTVVITDHRDDIPLMRLPEVGVYLIKG